MVLELLREVELAAVVLFATDTPPPPCHLLQQLVPSVSLVPSATGRTPPTAWTHATLGTQTGTLHLRLSPRRADPLEVPLPRSPRTKVRVRLFRWVCVGVHCPGASQLPACAHVNGPWPISVWPAPDSDDDDGAGSGDDYSD